MDVQVPEQTEIPQQPTPSQQAIANTSTDTLAHLVAPRVPLFRIGRTVGEARQAICGKRWDIAELLILTHDNGCLAGVVDTRDLWNADAEVLLADLRREWPSVQITAKPERAALTAHRHNVPALPVVDAKGIVIGCLSAETLMDILWQEHAADLHRFAGIKRETQGARRAFLYDTPFQRVRKRLPWLLVGAFGSGLATTVMAQFENALASDVSIAFFVPAIVYLADAVGTQTEAITVRGLTLEHRSLGHAILRETATGVLMGLILLGLALVAVSLGFGASKLVLAVGMALLAASSFASMFGVILPWLLDRWGFDPAFGAGPLATIIQDLASILLYFAMVSWLVL